MESDYYNTIEKPSIAEVKERGSRFIAYAFPIQDLKTFKEKLADIKKLHPKATHHCFAYRIGIDGNTFRVSDDGEPSGTAGKPILGQLDSKGLTNAVIFVVRYFGGTLLGVPGLISAYKTSASLALQTTAVVAKPILINYSIEFDYTLMNSVMKIIRQFECVILKNETQLFCKMEIGVPRNRLNDFIYTLKDIKGVSVEEMS